jgi:hypothetical protein
MTGLHGKSPCGGGDGSGFSDGVEKNQTCKPCLGFLAGIKIFVESIGDMATLSASVSESFLQRTTR